MGFFNIPTAYSLWLEAGSGENSYPEVDVTSGGWEETSVNYTLAAGKLRSTWCVIMGTTTLF